MKNKNFAVLLSVTTMMMLSGGYNSCYDRSYSNIDYTPCKHKGMSNKELGTSNKKKRKRK